LLQNQVAAVEENMPQGPGGPGGMVTNSIRGGQMISGGSSRSDAKPLGEMTITLDTVTILEIIAVAILLAFLAGMVSISRITKYEPIKILMERN